MRVLRVSHSAVVDAWRDRERAIRRRGVTVHLLSARRWDEAGAVVELRPRPGEPVEGVRTWGSHPALFLYDPRPLWRALGERWDVLDVHEEPFALATAEILVLRALRRQRAPYVLYTAQNLAKRYPVPFRWFERWALTHASAISACNAEAAAIVEAKGFPGVADVIPLGVDTHLFAPEADDGAPRRAAALADALVTVGYAGRLAPHKGVGVLLDAVAPEPRLRLRIAGAGPTEADLRATASAGGFAERVEFLGSVDTAELPAFYRSLDVLAVPSLTTPGWVEQFGRVAVEAMACGVPVVASDGGALPDVVGGAGILVPPGDARALRAALLAAAEPDRSAALRVAGRARAAACSWDAVGEAYAAMYRRVVRPRSGAAVEPPSGAGVPSPRGGVNGLTPGPSSTGAASGLEVIVVAYGLPRLVKQAVEPLRHLPVTVVDNSSLPEIAGVCADLGVRYLDPGRNGGFAAGVNCALVDRLVPGGDVLLVNPDAVVAPEDVWELHRALRADRRLASVGPAQVDGEGRSARVAWAFPSPGRTWLEAVGLGRIGRGADFVIGSVLLLRGDALAQVGTFDERFFLYAEETDWAYRAARLGWRHAAVPTARAAHLGGASSGDPVRREVHFHASQERYLRKHYGALGWQAARVGQVLGSAGRAVVLRGARRGEARRRLAVYLRGPVSAEARYPRALRPSGAAPRARVATGPS